MGKNVGKSGDIPVKIYFVRHGHPNYRDNVLTEVGHLQAGAVAKRLQHSGIEEIFSSTYGRAVQTALPTARMLGLEIELLDFMHEISCKSKTDKPIFADGSPWRIVGDMILKGEDLFDADWAESDRFSESIIGESVRYVREGLDRWLKTMGYEREGRFYRVIGEDTDRTVALFSHAGSATCALSHLLGVPFPWMLAVIRNDFTAVTVVEFGNEKGTLVFPKITLMNDARHIEGIEAEKVADKQPPQTDA